MSQEIGYKKYLELSNEIKKFTQNNQTTTMDILQLMVIRSLVVNRFIIDNKLHNEFIDHIDNLPHEFKVSMDATTKFIMSVQETLVEKQ